MARTVFTTKGEVDRDKLTVEDIIEESDNYRSIATEWKLDGELVRRDVHVMILSGVEMNGTAQDLG